jgi:hypothetical protein
MKHVAMIALAAAMAAGAAAPADAQQQEDFRWSGRIAQGNTVRIQGISGDVRAERATGGRVEVVARRTGRDAAEVEVRAVETGDGITICAVYPGSRGDGACNAGRGRTAENTRRRTDAEVDFTVRLPDGVRLRVGVVNGDVSATGLRSPVDASTVAGDIRISTTGTAEANTVSGDIDATFGVRDAGEMSFNAVSGDVTLRLAPGADARVSANTLSGSIDSDFALEREPRARSSRGGVDVRIGRSASGTIGRGGPRLGINTVSGDIRIVRAR